MKTYTTKDGTVLNPGQPFALGGTKFPGNWLDNATQSDLDACGIAVAVVADPPAPLPPPLTVTTAAFRLLFTPDEKQAITVAGETDATVRGFIDDAIANPTITLSLPQVQKGLAYLVGKGLLTQDRADQITTGITVNKI